MGRFDFASPGAAVSDTLTKLLVQRKNEQRQAMLDQLTVNADQRAADAATREASWQEEQKKNIEDEIAGRKQSREINLLDTLTAGMKAGDDPAALGVSPENIELGKRYGRWTSVAAPTNSLGIGTDVTSVVKPNAQQSHLAYLGTPQERLKKEQKARVGDLVATMMASSDPAVKQKGIEYSQVANLYDDKIPDNLAEGLVSHPLYTLDDYGKLVNHGMVQGDSHVSIVPRAPVEKDWVSGGIDPTTGFGVGFNTRTGEYKKSDQPIAKPGTTGKPTLGESLGINPKILDSINMNMVGLQNDPNDRPSIFGLRQGYIDAIENSKTSRTAQRLAHLYLTDMPRYIQEVQNLPKTPQSDRDLADLNSLRALMHPGAVEIIRRTKPGLEQ